MGIIMNKENTSLHNVKYRNNFLTNVVFRIDFKQLENFNDDLLNQFKNLTTVFITSEMQDTNEFITKIENNQVIAHKVDKTPYVYFL
jgi:hypothetical protein